MAAKKVTPQQDDLVLITWRDIMSFNSWVDTVDMERQVNELKSEMFCRAVGWVYSIDKDDVCVNAIDSDEGKHMIIVIPSGCIKNIEILKRA